MAEVKVKNDRIDARVLADLVRAELIAESYVPDIEVREQRAVLRQRRSFVEDTVTVKNRVHILLDKYDLKPEYTDLFGKRAENGSEAYSSHR
jgi:transposase